MKKENIICRGNDSLAIAGIWGTAGAAFACPLCIVASGAFFLNSLRQKIGD